MTYTNYNDFIAAVCTRTENLKQQTGWRYGQAFFNCLFDERPDIAEELRGTPVDPFYRTVVDTKTYETIRKLYEAQEKYEQRVK